MKSCLKDNIDPLVDAFNLPEDYPDFHNQLSKRSKKRKDAEEWNFAPKKKKKVADFLDENEVPLSERQRQMLLRDTSGVSQQSTKAPSVTTSGNSPIENDLLVSDFVISERVLPTQPSSSPSQNIPDNVKMYRIFGPICITFYLIKTIYYTVFYVYLQVFID